MIDGDIVATGLEALSVAIAVLLEDSHEAAANRLPAGFPGRLARIAELGAVGTDISTLAAAMDVLQRRREPEIG